MYWVWITVSLFDVRAIECVVTFILMTILVSFHAFNYLPSSLYSVRLSCVLAIRLPFSFISFLTKSAFCPIKPATVYFLSYFTLIDTWISILLPLYPALSSLSYFSRFSFSCLIVPFRTLPDRVRDHKPSWITEWSLRILRVTLLKAWFFINSLSLSLFPII